MNNLSRFLISETDTIMQAIAIIEANHMRCAVVVNSHDKVVGVVSQGDILQGLLNHIDVHSLVSIVTNNSFISFRERDLERAASVMHRKGVTLIPVLDEDAQLSDVITIRDVFDFKRCKDGSPKLPGASKDNVRILTIIPARGGSKGIPHKNIYPICGKPLLAYTIEVLQASAVSDALVVSTDDGKIKKVAEAYPGVMVIDRPGEIAGDDVSTEAALLHAVDYMHKQYQQDFDCIVTAQPTSPLRVPETVRRFVEEYVRESDKYDAQLTLTANYSDFWLRDLNGDFRRRSLSIPRLRQAREPLYTENSCLYITSIDALIETHSVLGTRCNGFVISEREAVDINTMHDIRIAQAYLEESGGYVTQ